MNIATESYPSPARAWWAMTVLFLAYTVSFIDRTILALLVEPLRRDLGLSDTEISLLQGLAFAIFYCTASIPIAAISDRKSRRGIIAIGIFFWSLATAACGLATSFWKLFAARLCVGIGEATLSPATFSLVGDLFPERLRGRALGFFASGIHIGAGLALIVGGAVVGLASSMGSIDTPVGELRSWQVVFLVVGLPGVLVAALAMTIPEPRRTAAAGPIVVPPFWPFARTRKAAIAAHFIGFSVCGLLFSGMSAWAPTFMIRHHHLTPAQSGLYLGLGVLVLGTLGALAGGALTDKWRDKPDAGLRVGIIGLFMQIIMGVTAPFVGDAIFSATLFSILAFFGGFAYPAGATSLQRLTPGPLRARMTAVYLLVVSVIGAAFGPTTIALITDRVFKDPAAVGSSMALAAIIIGPIGILILSIGLRPFGRAVLRQMEPIGATA